MQTFTPSGGYATTLSAPFFKLLFRQGNAIWFDWEHGTFWGGSGNHGEDYGLAW